MFLSFRLQEVTIRNSYIPHLPLAGTKHQNCPCVYVLYSVAEQHKQNVSSIAYFFIFPYFSYLSSVFLIGHLGTEHWHRYEMVPCRNSTLGHQDYLVLVFISDYPLVLSLFLDFLPLCPLLMAFFPTYLSVCSSSLFLGFFLFCIFTIIYS